MLLVRDLVHRPWAITIGEPERVFIRLTGMVRVLQVLINDRIIIKIIHIEQFLILDFMTLRWRNLPYRRCAGFSKCGSWRYELVRSALLQIGLVGMLLIIMMILLSFIIRDDINIIQRVGMMDFEMRLLLLLSMLMIFIMMVMIMMRHIDIIYLMLLFILIVVRRVFVYSL